LHCEPNIQVDISLITSVWFRRGHINIKTKTFSSAIDNYIAEENYYLKNYIYYLLSNKRKIGEINSSIINKLVVNDIARSLGLLTPETFLLTKKNEGLC